MPTIPQLIASAFGVLCGQYGDVTKMAKDREQSRQSLYREAEHVANAVLFFATRQTPTTGACIPVDGGLPDATPR